MKIETLILSNLIHDERFMRTTIPFLKEEYFVDAAEQAVFKYVSEFVENYNAPPSKEALLIVAQNDVKLSDDVLDRAGDIINSLVKSETTFEWVVDEAEKFCKDRALFNAIARSIQINDGRDKEYSKDAIPDLLRDALSVSFDTSVGHDYIEDAKERFEYYHRTEERIEFDIDLLNKITKGGLPRKTLNVILGGINVGKSLVMCHMAAANLAAGKNVLYITLEMAQERIAERIDANLMNVSLDDLALLPQKMFEDRMARVRSKTQGKLIIKEYPTSSAHAGHFRGLLNEVQLKKDFVPDIVYIDYINICASSRYKASTNLNSYTLVKAIAEELRGLSVEFNIPIVTATQVTRSGFGNSDMEMTDVAESFGLPATADFMFAIISNEELERLGQYLVKQLKNRYNSKSTIKRFLVGVDTSKMRLYDLDESAQRGITQDDDEGSTYAKQTGVTAGKFAGKNFEGIRV